MRRRADAPPLFACSQPSTQPQPLPCSLLLAPPAELTTRVSARCRVLLRPLSPCLSRRLGRNSTFLVKKAGCEFPEAATARVLRQRGHAGWRVLRCASAPQAVDLRFCALPPRTVAMCRAGTNSQLAFLATQARFSRSRQPRRTHNPRPRPTRGCKFPPPGLSSPSRNRAPAFPPRAEPQVPANGRRPLRPPSSPMLQSRYWARRTPKGGSTHRRGRHPRRFRFQGGAGGTRPFDLLR